MFEQIRQHYSGDVDLQLLVNGSAIPLSKLGPGYVVLAEPAMIPIRGEGEVLLLIDGRRHSWKVRIDHDAVPFDDTVTVHTIYHHAKGEPGRRHSEDRQMLLPFTSIETG